MIRFTIVLAFLTATVLSAPAEPPRVEPVSPDLRTILRLADFYQKQVLVDGFPILGSSKVSDDALREAAWIVNKLLGHRSDILAAMTQNKVRLTIMAATEYTTDVPEHSFNEPKIYWDRRARGLGATPRVPCVSGAEENILEFQGDPYPTENILIHEFAHAIHETGLNTVDKTFEPRLKAAFNQAKEKGLWAKTYAATNIQEYWAEAVQCWFDDNRHDDALHNHVHTRTQLREYDPEVAKLCAEVFGDGEWRYLRPSKRAPADRAHLLGLPEGTRRVFEWRKEPTGEKPRVSIQTAIGNIEVELDATKAPRTVENFLSYVHRGDYADGVFFRTVTDTNQPNDAIKIAVIQAKANPAKEASALPPIALERTRDTGLAHRDGTISMAREASADSATHHFFICIGDQPELDFGGKRNPDGQGFAAFGRVITGMDLVKKIHEADAEGQMLKEPVRIQRAVRTK